MPWSQVMPWRWHPEVRAELSKAKAAFGDSERVAAELLSDLDFISGARGLLGRHPAELPEQLGCRAFPSAKGDNGVLYVLFEEVPNPKPVPGTILIYDPGPHPDTILILLHLAFVSVGDGGTAESETWTEVPPLPASAWELAKSRRTYRSWSPL